MKKKIIYDDDARYTDAPPDVEEAFARSVRIPNFLPSPKDLVFKSSEMSEVDEAFDYAVKHNLFLTKQQIDELLNRNTATAVQPRPFYKKVAAML